MPEVVIKHNVKDAKEPDRDILPDAVYHAIIMKCTNGETNFTPALKTIQLEFSIVKTAAECVAAGDEDTKYTGRSVYQDYIIEPGTKTFANQNEAFRMQQLVSATGIPHKVYDEGQISFNTDHLIGKGVKITVAHRSSKPNPNDPKAPIRQFNKVDRIESEVVIKDEDLL